MKGKLITNGILSLVSLIAFIMLVVGIRSAVTHIEEDIWGNSHVIAISWNDIAYAVAGFWILIPISIASFVMGIVTLATKGSSGDNRGIVVASGVLAILGGLFGVNAIVSFIAAKGSK